MSVENHASFLSRLVGKFDARKLKLINLAYDQSKYGHRGQNRESGERYFEHPRCVALIIIDELKIFDEFLIISAFLHDIKEDSYLFRDDRIRMIFGPKILNIVDLLTKPRKDDKRFSSKDELLKYYFSKIMTSEWRVKIIKLADRLHNLRTLKACSPEKKKKQLEETRKYFLPLIDSLKKDNRLVAKFFAGEIGKFLKSRS